VCTASAQDHYFTQFYATPLELNPALSGAVEGSFRASVVYREQWSGLIDNPYQSYGVFGDLRFPVGGRNSKDFAGGGIAFTSDRVGYFDFNTNAIRLSGAFHKSLNPGQESYLSGGAYFGIVQRNLNYEGLIFDDQFNGLDGYTFQTLESLPENNFAYGDLGVGINYTMRTSDNFAFVAGAGYAHLFKSSMSMFRRTPELEDYEDIALFSKISGYVSTDISVTESVRLLPRVMFQQQGPQILANAGSTVRLEISEYNNNAIHLGGGLRMARRLEQFKPSALYGLVGFELSSFLIGVSYDLNLEYLSHERLGQNVFELTVTFIGEYENLATFCPTF
jgi:type IX secretion system PorP/SprF family membrane protein